MKKGLGMDRVLHAIPKASLKCIRLCMRQCDKIGEEYVCNKANLVVGLCG